MGRIFYAILRERNENESAVFHFLDGLLKRVEPKRVSFFIPLINLLIERNENASDFLFPSSTY